MAGGNLKTSAMAVTTLGILIAIVLAVLDGFQTSGALTTDGVAYNAVGSTITAVDDYVGWFAVIILISVGVYLFAKVKTFN